MRQGKFFYIVYYNESCELWYKQEYYINSLDGNVEFKLVSEHSITDSEANNFINQYLDEQEGF